MRNAQDDKLREVYKREATTRSIITKHEEADVLLFVGMIGMQDLQVSSP
jgi:hypothetical protein